MPTKRERGKRKKGNHREEGRKRGDYRGVIVGRWVKGRVTSTRGERVLTLTPRKELFTSYTRELLEREKRRKERDRGGLPGRRAVLIERESGSEL